MELITLEQAKNHLKVDYEDDDELINRLIASAFDEFEMLTNRKLYAADEVIPESISNGIQVRPSIIQGAYLLIGHWYTNREALSTGNLIEMPFATSKLWLRHRWVNV